MAKTIGSNRNTNDTANLTNAIAVNEVASVTISSENISRIFFCVSNNGNQDIWIKLQNASIDNDKKGIFLPKGALFVMPTNNIYTGEISAITDNGNSTIYITEY